MAIDYINDYLESIFSTREEFDEEVCGLCRDFVIDFFPLSKAVIFSCYVMLVVY